MNRSPLRFLTDGAALAMVLTGVLVALTPSQAQAQALSEPSPASTGGLNTAPIGRMRLSFSLLPAPLGSIKTDFLGTDISLDTAFAFGLRPAFDYSINDYFFVGFGPQLFFNVKGEDQNDAGKELDLLVRVGGHAPVAERLHLYGYLAPGYSIVYPPQGNENASGFLLGVTAGAIYSLPGNLFAVGDLGYQVGFHEITTAGVDTDYRLSYLVIGLGLGVKL